MSAESSRVDLPGVCGSVALAKPVLQSHAVTLQRYALWWDPAALM